MTCSCRPTAVRLELRSRRVFGQDHLGSRDRPRSLGELVFKRVDERQPACLDHVLGDADGPPDLVVILALDHDAHAGGRAGPGVDDADLVVDQAHLLQPRVVAFEGLPQCAVEGIDRSVSLADRVLEHAVDLELDRRLGRGLAAGFRAGR